MKTLIKYILLVLLFLPNLITAQSTFMHIYETERSQYRYLKPLPDNSVLVGGNTTDTISGNVIPFVAKIDHAGEILWQRDFYEYPDQYIQNLYPLPDGRFWLEFGNDTVSLIINTDGGIFEDDIVWNTPDYFGKPYLIEEDLDMLFMDVPDYYTAPDNNYHPILTKRSFTGDIIWQRVFTKDTFDTYLDLNKAIELEDGYLILSREYFDLWSEEWDWIVSDYITKYTKLDFAGNIVFHNSDTGYWATEIIPKAGGGFYATGVLSNLDPDDEPLGFVALEKNGAGNTLWFNSNDTILGVAWTGTIQRADGGFDLLGVGSSILDYSEEKVELYRFDAYGNLMDVNLIAFSNSHFVSKFVKCADGNYAMAGAYIYGTPYIDRRPLLIKTDSLGNIAKTEFTGRVYDDVNENGFFDAADKPKKNKLISVDDKPYYGMTDDDGNYRFFIYDSGTYKLNTVIPTYYFQQFPPDGDAHVITIDSVGVFADAMDFRIGIQDTLYDLVTTMYPRSHRPGHEKDVYVFYQNIGTIPSTESLLTLQIDSNNAYTGFTDGAYLIEDSMATWATGMIPPGFSEYRRIDVTLVPDFTLLGDSVHFIGKITPDTEDPNPLDNVFNYTGEISASYDPNRKSVQPAGVTEWGYIDPETELLVYTIEFQNTGNDTASLVILIDTMPTELQFASLEMIYATHNYTMQADYPNIYKWIFKDIILPDSSTNEPESKGFVQFRIRLQEGLPIGTSFSNKAAIYFDTNPPVITDPVFTTLQHFVPQAITENAELQFAVFPNPARDQFMIALNEAANISIYNAQGALIGATKTATPGTYAVNTSGWASGAYIIKAQFQNLFGTRIIFVASDKKD